MKIKKITARYLIAVIVSLAFIAIGENVDDHQPFIAEVYREEMPIQITWYGILEWAGFITLLWSLFALYHLNPENAKNND